MKRYLFVALLLAGCGGGAHAADSATPPPSPSESSSPTTTSETFCDTFATGGVAKLMAHVKRGDQEYTSLADDLSAMQARIEASADLESGQTAKAIRTAASRMGSLANEVAAHPSYAFERVVKLALKSAQYTGLTAALEAGC